MLFVGSTRPRSTVALFFCFTATLQGIKAGGFRFFVNTLSVFTHNLICYMYGHK